MPQQTGPLESPPTTDAVPTTLPIGRHEPEIVDIVMGDLTGVKLGSILIRERLGSGGMGEVWRGYDESLDIDVAVKILQPRLAQNPKYVRRFLREARAVARLDHPNIVRVFHARRVPYQTGSLRIMVMECIEGQDAHRARRLLPGRKFGSVQAAEIVLQVSKALLYAHKQGVIHRDIKPANIFIADADQSVKVLDFGLAKRLDDDDQDDSHQTKAGVLLGTPQYMGPEQILRHRADWRADIYSLGISFYEFLAGKVPFDGKEHLQVVRAHRDQEITFPEELFANVPEVMIEVVNGMCAKLPADRWSLARVIRELSSFLGESFQTGNEESSRVAVQDITNIPARVTSFVGRDKCLEDLLALCRAKTTNLVTILGPGGVGKTTLAREAARRLLGLSESSREGTSSTHGDELRWATMEVPREDIRVEGGAWFVDLSDAYSLNGIALAAGQAMGIVFNEEGALAQFVKDIAARGHILVVFDNCEQVSQEMREVARRLQAGAPQVKLILTSREPLNVEGEATFSVAPFDVSSGERATAALQLFEERAKVARREFSIGPHNEVAVLGIVRALDGIPLAIELAAARIGTLTPDKILERLGHRFDILRSRRRDSTRRHATLRSTIEWSWNLLTLWEKLALVQCSVFRGGFFLDAAEAVVDLSPFPEAPMAIDAIESLVEKNLMVAEDCATVVGEARYRLYESVREYAREALEGILSRLSSGDTTTNFADVLKRRAVFVDRALERRFVAFYLRYGQNQLRRYLEEGDSEALERLALELDNFDGFRQLALKADPVSAAQITIIADVVLRLRGPSEFRVLNLEEVWDALGEDHELLSLRIGALLIRAYVETRAPSQVADCIDRVQAYAKRVLESHHTLKNHPLITEIFAAKRPS